MAEMDLDALAEKLSKLKDDDEDFGMSQMPDPFTSAIQGEPVSVVAARHKPIDMRMDAAKIIPGAPPVAANPATGVADTASTPMPAQIPQQPNPTQPVDPTEALMKMIMERTTSPEAQALRAKLQEQSDKALKQQQSGIDENQSQVDNLQKGVNLQPLAQLVDTWTGSDFAKGMETPEARQEKIMALRNALQTQRQGLSKEQIDYMKSQLMNMDPVKQMAQLGKLSQGKQRIAQVEKRLGMTGDKAAASAVDSVAKEATNEQIEKQLYRIHNDAHTIAGDNPITPQVIREIESGIAAALSGGGISSDAARENIHIPQALDAIANIKQKYGNTVVDLRKMEPEKILALQETLARLDAALNDAKLQRTKGLMTGKDFNNIPQAKKALSDLGAKVQGDASKAKLGLLKGDDMAAYQHAQALSPEDPMRAQILQTLKAKHGFDF